MEEIPNRGTERSTPSTSAENKKPKYSRILKEKEHLITIRNETVKKQA